MTKDCKVTSVTELFCQKFDLACSKLVFCLFYNATCSNSKLAPFSTEIYDYVLNFELATPNASLNSNHALNFSANFGLHKPGGVQVSKQHN